MRWRSDRMGAGPGVRKRGGHGVRPFSQRRAGPGGAGRPERVVRKTPENGRPPPGSITCRAAGGRWLARGLTPPGADKFGDLCFNALSRRGVAPSGRGVDGTARKTRPPGRTVSTIRPARGRPYRAPRCPWRDARRGATRGPACATGLPSAAQPVSRADRRPKPPIAKNAYRTRRSHRTFEGSAVRRRGCSVHEGRTPVIFVQLPVPAAPRLFVLWRGRVRPGRR